MELKAKENCWLTDGNSFVKVITVANKEATALWREISQEEYEQLNPQPEEENA